MDDHRGGKIVIDLIGRINKVGVLSPRFDVKYGEYENWVNNVLPSRQVCVWLDNREPCLYFFICLSFHLFFVCVCIYIDV